MKKLSEIGDTRFALASILPTKPGTAILILLSACLSDGGSETTPTDPSQGQAPTNSAPTISGAPPNAVKTGDDYSFTPTASDTDGDALTFSIDNKPIWATFDSSPGLLSGQPSLGDIVGYFIYYGNTSGSFPNRIRIDNPSISTSVVDNLLPSNYFIVATLFNSTGVESGYSKEAVKTVDST